MSQKKHKPYVPEDMKMTEFTVAAVAIGLVMSVVLGAANAYLGLKAGITIAATYPAAVIGMALLRAKRGTILEENIARTAGSIGESIAAGAIFTLPAFVISKSWPAFDFEHAYLKSTALMLVGGVLGCAIAFYWNGYTTATMGMETFSEIVFEFRVTPKLVVEGLVFAFIVGLIGTLFPAIRAARLPVILALKSI